MNPFQVGSLQEHLALMMRLKSIQISGFKSIQNAEIVLGDLNIVIGPNGAGKTNLAAFFDLLHAIGRADLDRHVALNGGAKELLAYGPKITRKISTRLLIQTENHVINYEFELAFRLGNHLLFENENMESNGIITNLNKFPLTSGLPHVSEGEREIDPTAHFIQLLLKYCGVFHFGDTSPTASIRLPARISDDVRLHRDGGNLAAFLLRLSRSEAHAQAYHRIVTTVRLIAPSFDDFVLEPNDEAGTIQLRWREKGRETVFGTHQLSDGTLRAMALITLLLQPEASLPLLMVIDEPELGLHPYARGVVASLLRSATQKCQILVLTQSTPLLDQFDPDDVVVVDRTEHGSTFRRLDPDALSEWLSEYTLSELWQKNMIGGRPGAWSG